QVEEALVVEPATAGHHLVVHHRDMRRRAAECGEPEPSEEAGQLPQGPTGGQVAGAGHDAGPVAGSDMPTSSRVSITDRSRPAPCRPPPYPRTRSAPACRV